MTSIAPVDLLGVGFGPAAIAVATAIEDELERLGPHAPRLAATFLERAASSAWQPNMLLAGTDIQHHFLRDYATPRNPRSRFTFPNYLVDTGRFFPFTLMGGYVSRHEWSEYTEWVARQITLPVRYHAEVVEAEPVLRDGRAVAARVRCRDTETGEHSEQLARNVLLCTGHLPFVPDLFTPHLGERVFHAAEFLTRISAIPTARLRRVAVIGAGQNAGEIILHLAGALPPDVEIHSLARNSGFRMYNLGHFSNEAYFPAETDYFYALDHDQRQNVFAELHSTNYASVDPDLSTALYRAAYDDGHWGAGRLRMRKRTAVDRCAPAPGGGYRLGLREVNTGAAEELDVDLIVLCTGYREPKLPAVLGPFADYLDYDEFGDPVVSRDFRLGLRPDCAVGLYVSGITEWRHGINSATSFSTMAIKGAEIVADMLARRDGTGAGATADPAANGHAGNPVRIGR
jgi:L-ornithine N5-oxygenase